MRETLALMERAGDAISEEEGVMLDYVNPLTGGPTLPTIDAHAQLIRPGEHTRAVRDTACRMYHVLDGRGTSIIGGQRLDWEKGDTFCAPTWAWREHLVASARRRPPCCSRSTTRRSRSPSRCTAARRCSRADGRQSTLTFVERSSDSADASV